MDIDKIASTHFSETRIHFLVQGFLQQTLHKEDWTHEAHLIVATWHTLRYPADQALECVRTGILQLNDAQGTANTASSGYHETLTQFWMWVTGQLVQLSPEAGLVTQCNTLITSTCGSRTYPLKYYSQELLFSAEARLDWKAPDLSPLKFESTDVSTPKS